MGSKIKIYPEVLFIRKSELPDSGVVQRKVVVRVPGNECGSANTVVMFKNVNGTAKIGDCDNGIVLLNVELKLPDGELPKESSLEIEIKYANSDRIELPILFEL